MTSFCLVFLVIGTVGVTCELVAECECYCSKCYVTKGCQFCLCYLTIADAHTKNYISKFKTKTVFCHITLSGLSIHLSKIGPNIVTRPHMFTIFILGIKYNSFERVSVELTQNKNQSTSLWLLFYQRSIKELLSTCLNLKICMFNW